MTSPNSALGRDALRLLGLAAGLALLDLVVPSQFHRSIIILAMIFSIAAIGLTLLMGFAGQVSLGQSAFVGLGAYMCAFALQSLALPIGPALAASVVVPAGIGFVVARPILRLAGNTLALATLALGAVFYVVATQWTAVTGGIDPGIRELSQLRWFGFGHDRAAFWLTAACLVGCTGVALMLVDSRFGRALAAIKTSEVVASCMGVDVARTKAAVFALAAGFAGLSGALLGVFLRSFNAGTFTVNLSIELLMMVIVGSLTNVWGALFGASVIVVLPNLLEGFDQAKLLVYGLTMVAIMMFAPSGLGDTLWRLLPGKRSAR